MKDFLATLLTMDLSKRVGYAPPHYRNNFMSKPRRKIKGWMRDHSTGKVRR